MKISVSIFVSTVTALASLLPAVSADQLRYDTTYDNGAQSLSTVACSNGANGLLTKGFTNFKSLPSFPNIGGAVAVTQWNSTGCGTCWKVTYTNPAGATKSLNILAIDVALNGFVVSEGAMNTLTGGNAVQLGVVNVVSQQVNASACGL